MGRPIDLLRLGRVHTAAATAAVPGMACYLAGGEALPVLLVSLGAFLHHAWGFSLNEIMDLKIDSRSRELSDKPLVSGRLGRKGALAFSLVCLLAAFALFSGAAFLAGKDMLLTLALLSLATVAGGTYDVLGKRFTLSDVLVAMWMLFLVLSSATVGGDIGLSVWAVAALSSVHLLFNNSVEGGLKDVENDRSCGVPTLATVTGCSGYGGKLKVTTTFFIWAVLLRGAFVTMAAVFGYLISDEAGWGDWYTLLISIMGFVLFMDALGFLKGGKRMERGSLLRAFSVHEMASFGLSLMVVLPAAGPWAVLVGFLVPVAWFVLVNRIMFRSSMSPKV